MKKNRFGLSLVATFLFIGFFNWLFHGVFLKGAYAATANLWRTEADMSAHFVWLVVSEFLFSLLFCFIFTQGYQNKGLREGVRYGFFISLLLAAPYLTFYAVEPYPASLVAQWIVGNMIEYIGAGLLLAAVYRPRIL